MRDTQSTTSDAFRLFLVNRPALWSG